MFTKFHTAHWLRSHSQEDEIKSRHGKFKSAFFYQPLELKIEGKYVESDCHVWLYDENREELKNKPQVDNTKMVFELDYFSSYSYDFYEY